MIDNGIGIKQRDQHKLFKLFGRQVGSKRKLTTNGIGLGLSVCKLIVEKFNGQIKFVSHLNEGSNFHFTFDT